MHGLNWSHQKALKGQLREKKFKSCGGGGGGGGG